MAPSTPSVADLFYLAFYPLAYIAVVLYIRREAQRLSAPSWLDGLVAGLGAAAVCATFAFHSIVHSAGGGDLSVAALAEAAAMTERSFVRHYRRVTGTTPARAIERIRVEAARQALEQGLSVKRVAPRCGFGSEETMRRSFQRLLGATPQAYQERFSADAASGE